MVWRVETATGEVKTWYEQELIDFIKKLCLENMQNDELYGICQACVHGKASMAQRILDIIQEAENGSNKTTTR